MRLWRQLQVKLHVASLVFGRVVVGLPAAAPSRARGTFVFSAGVVRMAMVELFDREGASTEATIKDQF